jgi:transcriptional regulator with GAF, ATPase, and Fis domain
LAARLADHYCSQQGPHSFCERVLSDVVRELDASHGWIVRADTADGWIESLAHHGDSSDERAWRAAMAVVSPLLKGEAPLEQLGTEDGGRSVAVALRDGSNLFGAICLHLERSEPVEAGAHRLLVQAARLLSIYLRAALSSPAREEARRTIDSKLLACCYPPGIVGRSAALVRVLERVQQVAPTNATVLVEGENGTGKELVARALHQESRRAEKPWVVVNCAAIPEQLLESELFGHERGAFTGAFERKAGRFEQADGGTVFLDEIGEMAPSLQVKLLRLLQEKTVQRLGGGRDIPVDVRFIAATNRNLAKMKAEGTFREDLYWRLYVVPIRVPPLRERPEDIRPLVAHFVRRYAEELRIEPPRIDPSVLDCFQGYHWPGNVRELQHLVHRLMILSRNGHVLEMDLPADLRGSARIEQISRPEPFGELLATVPETYDELMQRRRDLLRQATRSAKKLENDFVDGILERHRGNKTKAAEDTGMHRTLIHRNLRKRGVLVAE